MISRAGKSIATSSMQRHKSGKARGRRAVLLIAFALSIGLFALAASADAATAPFKQCPAVGAAPTCNVLVTVNGNGTATTQVDSSIGPYDGIEDMLVGVQNDSARAVSDITVVGGGGADPLFGFDGDGLCAYVTCSWSHTTGYEGPISQFVPDLSSADRGTVHFTSLLAPSASTYFSLEGEPTTSSAATVTPTSTVKPAPAIDPNYWSVGHGHAVSGGSVTPAPVGSSFQPPKTSSYHPDACFAKFGKGGSTKSYTTSGLFGHKDKHTVHNLTDSRYMVCNGFGADPKLLITTAMKCATVAAIGGIVVGKLSKAGKVVEKPKWPNKYDLGTAIVSTAGCEYLSKDVTAASAACDWLSSGLGLLAGPYWGALATGACAAASPTGQWFEGKHEQDIARDVVGYGLCIVESDERFGINWHAEACNWKP